MFKIAHPKKNIMQTFVGSVSMEELEKILVMAATPGSYNNLKLNVQLKFNYNECDSENLLVTKGTSKTYTILILSVFVYYKI